MPPTESEHALHACLDGLQATGPSNIVQGIKIAQLALKHRRNKNGGARIVMFIGSPITERDGTLKKLGIGLRRSNVRPLPCAPLPGLPRADERVVVGGTHGDTYTCVYVCRCHLTSLAWASTRRTPTRLSFW